MLLVRRQQWESICLAKEVIAVAHTDANDSASARRAAWSSNVVLPGAVPAVSSWEHEARRNIRALVEAQAFSQRCRRPATCVRVASATRSRLPRLPRDQALPRLTRSAGCRRSRRRTGAGREAVSCGAQSLPPNLAARVATLTTGTTTLRSGSRPGREDRRT
jgi:hypothetical protein